MNHRFGLFAAGLELTLACPCRCETCGSGAGRARKDELSTEQWLKVIDELSELGCQRISFLGGEPLLRRDWPELATHAVRRGLRLEMVTSGVGLNAETAGRIYGIGFTSVTVSLDGTQQAHDEQRGLDGCYEKALKAVRLLDRAGTRVGVTTQVNRKSLPTLDDLALQIEAAGALGWQLQLTLPKGRAENQNGMAVQPEMMPEIYRAVRRLIARRTLRPYITDNIGYLTPDDPLLRTPPRVAERCWLGCFAGLRNIGITSRGDVKGCLALPDSLIEGNVRDEQLQRIWNDPDRFAYNRAFDPADLSGACAGCPYGAICRGGCIATAMAFHGKPGISTHCLRLHGIQ